MISDRLASLASVLLQLRKMRNSQFSNTMFSGDEAWGLLLSLFVADTIGTRLTGRMALEGEACSRAVGNRWLRYLGDGEGDLDDPLTLTPLAVSIVETWLENAHQIIDEGLFQPRS